MPRNTEKSKTFKSTEKKNTKTTIHIQSPAIRKEVKCIGLVAGGVLLLISVFVPNAIGFVGEFIRAFLLGIIGLGAFVFPIGLIVAAFFALTARKVSLPIVQSVFLSLFILSFLHIFNRIVIDSAGDDLTGFEYLGFVYRNGAVFGGGVVGALLGEILRNLLGSVGAIIVLLVGIIILMVLLTGRSFVDLVGRSVDRAKDYYDDRAEQRKIQQEYDNNSANRPPPARAGRTPRDAEELKPLPKRRRNTSQAGGHRQGFMDIDVDSIERDEHPKILLVQEEIEEQARETAKKSPLFARRNSVQPRAKRAEIVEFPGKNAANEETYEESDVPVINGLMDDEPDFEADDGFYEDGSVPVLEIIPTADEDVLFEDDYDYDEYKNTPIKINSATPLREDDATAHTAVDFNDDADDDFNDAPVVIPIKTAPSAPAPRFAPMPEYENYQMPPISFLGKNERQHANSETRTQVHKNSLILEETLRNFRVEAKVIEVSIGPTVTRYDLAPGPGVKVSAIANLSNDLALALAAQGIRIEAPIPGKSAVGIEIPNKDPQGVFLREIIEDEKFETFQSKLAFAVGKDIAGSPVVTDVARMPHLLIAGATGSGKSVCINTLIASLLYKARPDEVKLLMIDPKVVELSVYNGIPHLLIPVVTDPKKASGALNWAVQEMENRYAAFAETGCRDLKGFNRHMMEKDEQRLPQIVIIIDELADLMMTCKGEVEEAICRLAQKARAAGIHLIVATQRPSVDVITGLIKANIPSRLAFAVSSGTDSRTVLDMYGAEKLLGRGDMLFLPIGQNKPIRVQGGFISDKEVENLVSFLKAQAPVEHTTEMIQQITMPGKAKIEGEVDEFFHDAVEFLLAKGKASTSMLQRQFRIGYNRASRLMEDLEMRGIVGPEDGVKPRKVTITREEYREIYGDNY